MTINKNIQNNKKKIKLKPKHDELFRKSMENSVVAKDFLKAHLPDYLLEIIDLNSVKLEKDTFVGNNLEKSAGDVIFSVKCNDKSDGFILLMCEHQSTVCKDMPLRLLKYMIHIFDAHMSKNPKKPLPIIYQLLLYNGKKPYKAPLNIWDMSTHPELAKKLWNNDFQLINVHNISDEELKGRIWSGIFELMMKHIHDPNLIKIWRDIEGLLPEIVKIDSGVEYLKAILNYSAFNFSPDDKIELNEILENNLHDEGEI